MSNFIAGFSKMHYVEKRRKAFVKTFTCEHYNLSF